MTPGTISPGPDASGTNPSDADRPVALPLVANGRRVAILVVALVVVAGGAFAAGSLVQAPDQTAIDAVGDHLDVTQPVEERVVAPGVELPGRVVPGTVVPLQPAAESKARSIVTRGALSVGQAITTGTLLGEVSGAPLIAVPQGVPLYRDLVDGSKGADVSALQSALEQVGLDVSSTGEVGSRTLAAVDELYERAGAENPDATTIRWAELLPVPGGATVVTAAPVGAVLSEEVPLATVKVSPDVIVVRATVLEEDQLAAGQAVELRTAAATAASSVLAVGAFGSTEQGAGRDILISIPADFPIAESQPVTVSTAAETAAGPAVPTIALRQDARGTFIELPGEKGRQRVDVTVVAQSAGWTAIKPDDRLPVGTPVLVSP